MKTRIQHEYIRDGNVVLPTGVTVGFDSHGVSDPIENEDAEVAIQVPGYFLFRGEDSSGSTTESVKTATPDPETETDAKEPVEPPAEDKESVKTATPDPETETDAKETEAKAAVNPGRSSRGK